MKIDEIKKKLLNFKTNCEIQVEVMKDLQKSSEINGFHDSAMQYKGCMLTFKHIAKFMEYLIDEIEAE